MPDSDIAPTTDDLGPPWSLFVLTPADFDCELPFEFAHGAIVRRASESELPGIQGMLNRTKIGHTDASVRYEYECVGTKKLSGTEYKYVPLPREKWRYTLLSVGGPFDESSYLLERCTALLNPPIDIGFAMVPMKDKDRWVHGYSHQSAKLLAYADAPIRFCETTVHITKAQMDELGRYWTAARALPSESFVLKALESFEQTRHLPLFADAVTIALVGVIESLVTHMPEPKDTLDSISRQLRGKMKLLRKRFVRTLDPATYFDTTSLTSEDKVWSKLYAYRSTLAHGSRPDFAKEFKALKNRTTVIEFLREAVRLLLIQGIQDEEFLADLREC